MTIESLGDSAADPSILEILRSGEFRTSIEIVPSFFGAEFDQLITSKKPSFIAVTQGAGGSERSSSLALLRSLASYSVPRLAHLVCGFRPAAEVLAQAEEFYATGIRNFLVIKGDLPQAPAQAPRAETAVPAQELAAQYQFAFEAVRDLRAKFSDIVIGVAAYPDESSREKRVEHMKRKFEAGADFAVTQMIFDAKTYEDFVVEIRAAGITAPILPGVSFLHSRTHAEQVATRFDVRVPVEIKKQLPQSSVAILKALINDLKRAKAPGVHVFVLRDTVLAESAL